MRYEKFQGDTRKNTNGAHIEKDRAVLNVGFSLFFRGLKPKSESTDKIILMMLLFDGPFSWQNVASRPRGHPSSHGKDSLPCYV